MGFEPVLEVNSRRIGDSCATKLHYASFGGPRGICTLDDSVTGNHANYYTMGPDVCNVCNAYGGRLLTSCEICEIWISF